MWATCRSASEYSASRPRRSTPTSRAPRSTRRCCETSGWLIPSRATSSCTKRGCSASSVTMASRAGAASTFSSSPAASNPRVCGDTKQDKHMHICLCKPSGHTWLAGGGDLVGQFADQGLLDEILLEITPRRVTNRDIAAGSTLVLRDWQKAQRVGSANREHLC